MTEPGHARPAYLRRNLAFLLLTVLIAGCATKSSKVTRRDAADPIAAGFQADTFVVLDDILVDAVEQHGRVPGAVLAVARNGVVVYERAIGERDFSSDGSELPVERDTLFDIASLTKPFATAPAAALMICRKQIDPADALAGEPIDRILRHATGLPQYLDWHDLVRAGEDLPLEEAIEKTLGREGGPPLESVTPSPVPPGTSDLAPSASGYSNAGYLLLSAHLESVASRDLETYLADELWKPLGMTHTTYRPTKLAGATIARTDLKRAAGRPYDPLADYVLERRAGHVPGHSGLFSTAGDLSIFCQALLNPASSSVPQLDCIARLYFSDEPLVRARSTGGVGFAAHRKGRTLALEPDAEWPGRPAFYHTGYTGCLVWMDCTSGTSVVLLTNSTLDKANGWLELQREVLNHMHKTLQGRA